MNINEKVSIIIPVYNVENYLRRCIDSLLAQSYQNIEILMIDEGEYDNDFEDRDLIAYNLDSLVAVQIIIWMEKEFGIEIDLEKLEMDNLKSIKNMRDFLKEYNIII